MTVTWRPEGVGSRPTRAHGVKTLGKFVTPMWLSPSSTSWYWLDDGDARRLGRLLRTWQEVMAACWQVWFVCGWQVKLCDRLVTRGPYLNSLEIKGSV